MKNKILKILLIIFLLSFLGCTGMPSYREYLADGGTWSRDDYSSRVSTIGTLSGYKFMNNPMAQDTVKDIKQMIENSKIQNINARKERLALAQKEREIQETLRVARNKQWEEEQEKALQARWKRESEEEDRKRRARTEKVYVNSNSQNSSSNNSNYQKKIPIWEQLGYTSYREYMEEELGETPEDLDDMGAFDEDD